MTFSVNSGETLFFKILVILQKLYVCLPDFAFDLDDLLASVSPGAWWALQKLPLSPYYLLKGLWRGTTWTQQWFNYFEGWSFMLSWIRKVIINDKPCHWWIVFTSILNLCIVPDTVRRTGHADNKLQRLFHWKSLFKFLISVTEIQNHAPFSVTLNSRLAVEMSLVNHFI